MKHFSMMNSLAHAFQIPMKGVLPNPQLSLARPLRRLQSLNQQSSPFTSSATAFAKDKRQKIDQRITLIRYFLQHPLTPRPLRLSRLRSLRHWTIHRAWQLYQHKLRTAARLELQRQYNCMRDACEELRVGAGDGGRLYNQAMVKKGIYGGLAAEKGREGGVPIEYTRAQTEGPPRAGFDEGWRR